MKRKEFFDKCEEDCLEDCFVCAVHARAETKIPNSSALACPFCKKPISFSYFNNVTKNPKIRVIGESNYCDHEDHYRKNIVFGCPYCAKEISVKLEKIIYNGNHGVYYTGGKKYTYSMDSIKEKTKERILPLIENYTQRIKNGEKLIPSNLRTWINYEIDKICAEILYENGLQGRDIDKEEE